MAKHKIYTIYAELADYEPKIWRRFEINGQKTIAELVYITMIQFEMQASHLYELTLQLAPRFGITNLRQRYRFYPQMMPPEYEEEGVMSFPAEEHTLNNFGVNKDDNLTLLYDFGDGWEVHLRVESVEEKEISLKEIPRVIAGEGFGIIEDCGGPGGLAHVVEVLAVGHGDEYDHLSSWLGVEQLDFTHFDREEMNIRIKKLLRVYRQSYEEGMEPSRQMLKFLLRQE